MTESNMIWRHDQITKIFQESETKFPNPKSKKPKGRGGGQVVSVLAFYSDDTSSNPAEVYSFSVILCLKRTKKNKKEAGFGPCLKKKPIV